MVSNEKNIKKHVADGTIGPYVYDFRIDNETDLLVIETDTVTGADLTKTVNTHYTVSGVGLDAGGSVTFISPHQPALGKRLTLARHVTATQTTDIPLNGPLPSDAVEQMMDKLAFLAQQQNRALDHAIKTPITDTNPPAALPAKEVRAEKYFIFDSNGDPAFVSTAIAGTTPVSSFMATVVDDSNADTAIKTLADGATAETVIASGDQFLLLDVSANAGRKMTLENIYKGLNSLTEDTIPVHDTDFVLAFDVSAGTVKKAKFSNFRSNSYYRASSPSTSGTVLDFTGIPAGVTRLTLGWQGVSFNATDGVLIQLGDSGGFETVGYTGTLMVQENSVSATVVGLSSGFLVGNLLAADALYGEVSLTLLDPATNLWSCTGGGGNTGTVRSYVIRGTKALSAVLTQIRFKVNGAGSFDGGTIYVVGGY